MSVGAEGTRFLEFDGIRFEVESGELTGREGRTTRLAPQPARLLALLAAEADRVVSREAIAEHLWPHGSVEVDQGIGYAMREVRKALEAVGGDPGMIETIPRRGFRCRAGRAPDPAAALAVAAERPEPSSSSRRRAPALAWLVGLLAVGVLSVALLMPGATTETPVLAVFEHDSGEGAVARGTATSLGTALTSRLTQELGGRVGVIGPTGTAALSGPDDTEEARATLGACLVLSGGLDVLADSRVVVFTQVVRTSDRVHVWASTDTVPGPEALDLVVPAVLEGVAGALPGCRT